MNQIHHRFKQDRFLATRKGRRYIAQGLWRSRFIYLMIMPVTAYFLIVRYWAMGWISMAFFDYKLLRGFSGSNFVGLKHFEAFITGINFQNILGNTLLINLQSLLLSFPVPIVFALFLNEIRRPAMKKAVQTISYLPHFLSTVVIVSMMSTLLSVQTGAANNLLRAIGASPVYFMGSPAWFRPVYIISGIWQGTGWGAIIYISALSGISQELYEAARADGAGRFRQMWHVSLPGIRETIVIMLIMRIGNMMTIGFEKPFLMQNPLNISVSEMLSTYTYKIGLERNNYSLSTAIGLFNSLVSLLLVVTANAVSRKLTDTSLF